MLVHCRSERGHHVWRGGSFNNNRRNARSSYRNNNQPHEQNQILGFQLAGGCGTGLTACCQSPAEESAGACHSTSGLRGGATPATNDNCRDQPFASELDARVLATERAVALLKEFRADR